ncbi:MAG: hypothetical protein JXB05_00840 [Myxococcaceae bacterium]|nr:hypothetical protein [Myxococcaceae bacterium]
MTGPESSSPGFSPAELDRLKVEGDLRLREAELELRKREQESNRKTAALSSPVIVAVFSALFGVLGTGLGAGLQGYWNASLEQQKFEYGLLEKALVTDNDPATDDLDLAKKKLLFLVESGVISRLDREQIKRMASDPSQLPVVQGQRDRAAVNRIVDAINSYQRKHGSYPESLTHLITEYPQLPEEIPILRNSKIRYEPDPGRGYVLTFAGQDGALDTRDDKIHDKTGLVRDVR